MIDEELLKIIDKAIAEKSSGLNLSGKNLTQLPIEVTQVSHLGKLVLSNNKLSQLPSNFAKISELKYLDISSNQLSQLPQEITKLSKISWLSLSKNKLTQLPPEIGQLSHLEHLLLDKNQLNQLPLEVANLSELITLSLRDNQLSEIPLEIAQLSRLTRLDLRGNEQLQIPPEILNKVTEPATILNFYKDLQQAKSKKSLNEIKILVVGQGAVGKTSLIKRLMDESLNPNENKTEGINVRKCFFSLNNNEKIQANIWDFGGQDIMHATHQFFLTKRSIYLLILDNRLEQEANRVEYWLKIINSFSDDSPIIIVGNKKDQHSFDINQKDLMKNYPNIKFFVGTSCVNNDGIDELREDIITIIRSLKYVHDKLPLPWFLVKQKLEEMSENYITYKEFEDLCLKEGIIEKLSQRTLLRFLHDLGVVLNFQDDLRLADNNVLNPEWVTNAVYKILNNRELMVERNGVLHSDKLGEILDIQKYPITKHIFILDMMRKFELCFPMDKDCTYLIPDLLPKEEIFTGTWENASIFQYCYTVLPQSIMSRFIVRSFQTISKSTFWRNGVVLSYEEGKNTALIKADHSEGSKNISIYIEGSKETRCIFLNIIRSNFEHIHATIPGINFTEKISFYTKDSNLVCFDYKELIRYEEAGKSNITERTTMKDFNVKAILAGINPEPVIAPESVIDSEQVKVTWWVKNPALLIVIIPAISTLLVAIIAAIPPLLTALGVQKIVENWMSPSPAPTQSSPSSGNTKKPNSPPTQTPAKAP